MKLTYPNPINAVFLRSLAWECYVAKNIQLVKDAKQQLQTARQELGLPLLNPTGGALDDHLQKLRDKELLTPKNTPPAPREREWENEWRLLYLPNHSQVRQLSDNPITNLTPGTNGILQIPEATPFQVTVRDTTLPPLEIICGKPKDANFLSACASKRGVYFLRLPEKLYVGKSDEGQVRFRQHASKKNILWVVFVSLAKNQDAFTLDSLQATEALLISFWYEVCLTDNGNRGHDREPAFSFLQQAILLTKSASAALIWLMRDTKSTFANWSLPFKKARLSAWPDCYMQAK